MSDTRVFIGGLPADFTERDLRALLDSYCINCSSIKILRPGTVGCCASAMTTIQNDSLRSMRAFEGMHIDGRKEVIRLGIKGEARGVVISDSGDQITSMTGAEQPSNIFTELMRVHPPQVNTVKGIPTCLYFTVVLDPGNKFNADVLERLVRRCGRPLKIRIERRKDGSHGWVVMDTVSAAFQCKTQLSGKYILDSSLLIHFEDSQKRGFFVQGKTNLQRDYQLHSNVVCIGGIPIELFTIPVLRNLICCYSNVSHLQLIEVEGVRMALAQFGNYDEVASVIAKINQLMIYESIMTCEATELQITPLMNDPHYWDHSNQLPPPNRFSFPNDLRGLEWNCAVSSSILVSELPLGYITDRTRHLLVNYFYSLGAQCGIGTEDRFIFDFPSPDFALSCLLKYHGTALPFVEGPTGYLLYVSFSDRNATGEPAVMATFNKFESHQSNICYSSIVENYQSANRNVIPVLQQLHSINDEMEL